MRSECNLSYRTRTHILPYGRQVTCLYIIVNNKDICRIWRNRTPIFVIYDQWHCWWIGKGVINIIPLKICSISKIPYKRTSCCICREKERRSLTHILADVQTCDWRQSINDEFFGNLALLPIGKVNGQGDMVCSTQHERTQREGGGWTDIVVGYPRLLYVYIARCYQPACQTQGPVFKSNRIVTSIGQGKIRHAFYRASCGSHIALSVHRCRPPYGICSRIAESYGGGCVIRVGERIAGNLRRYGP